MSIMSLHPQTPLSKAYNSAVARFTAAVENIVSDSPPYKVYDIQGGDAENNVFKIPMIPFKWEESFEGLQTMLLDDNDRRSICVCKSAGRVRLPLYSHKRNERIVIIEGSIIDHILEREYKMDDTIDFPKGALRDLEFIDCIFSIFLTPPLNYNIQK